MEESFDIVAKSLFGFEDILAREIEDLGGVDIEKGIRVVKFKGDKRLLYKVNLCSRFAVKVFKPILSFKARNEFDLYAQVYKINWEEYLDLEDTFAVDSIVNSDLFTNSRYITYKVKDAIVDRFTDKYDKRPNVDVKYPTLKVNTHIQGSTVNINLDSSGKSLHLRGYRTSTNLAPINEILAAGILQLSGWKGRSDFLDPMCGSGTILIEAAMMAMNIPPNINRNYFAFQEWEDYDDALYEEVREEALNNQRKFEHKIVGYDKAPSAVAKAIENIKHAGLEAFITVHQKNFFGSEKFTDQKLHMVFNPPYGERLRIDYEQFYKNIGDTFKQFYNNTHAWLITSNREALKSVGLKTSRKIKVFNGKLEARLVKYEIYEGSKKMKNAEDQTE